MEIGSTKASRLSETIDFSLFFSFYGSVIYFQIILHGGWFAFVN
jgi:hypothetical protein